MYCCEINVVFFYYSVEEREAVGGRIQAADRPVAHS